MCWNAESREPLVGESWRTDEVYMKILGERKYLFAMLDADARFWLARQVATHSRGQRKWITRLSHSLRGLIHHP